MATKNYKRINRTKRLNAYAMQPRNWVNQRVYDRFMKQYEMTLD